MQSMETAPIIKVKGEIWTELPKDLYIPPKALAVFLEAFEGPLDLLLYLIKRQNIDILDIPIALITRQYIEYIDLMTNLQIELAAEYLVMAAMLAEIKSRMLLPTYTNEEGEEEDPRAELVRQLQDYERYKQAAEEIDKLPREGRDTFAVLADAEEIKPVPTKPNLGFKELILAFNDVLQRASLNTAHHVIKDTLSVRERMSLILDRLQATNEKGFLVFHECFDLQEGRRGVVVTFIAILELIKESMVEVVQSEPYSSIHVKAITVC